MRIAMGADHAGFELKRDLAAALAQQGHDILDVGTHTTASVDYPDIAEAVATAIRNGQVDRGIIVCGSGAGVTVAANKVPGIRAAVCHDTYTARQAVEHDDINVLCLGARVIGAAVARLLAETFIAATFSADDRHLRRLAKIDAIESSWQPRVSPLDFAEWVQSLGAWGPLAFVAGYIAVTLLVMPAFLLTLAAGALWGFWLGLLLAMTGAVCGATCAFVAARSVLRGVVSRYVARHPRLVAIDRAVESEGARLVFLLRLSPAVPFVLLNYVLGVSRISVRAHFIGLVGMIPTAAMYVYAGKVAGDIAALASGAAVPRGTAYYLLLTLGLAATILATVLVTRAAKRALRDSHRDLA